MKKIWKRIETWLEQNAPDIRADLQPGASDAILRKAASVFEAGLPDDLNDSYRIHDGTRGSVGPLLGDWRLLSLAAAERAWSRLKARADAGDFEDMDEGAARPEIKDVWWNPRWIPVASNSSGDFLCSDLDPAAGGERGQIISYYHAEPRREVVASSFEHWLAGFAEDLEAGRYRVQDNWLTKMK